MQKHICIVVPVYNEASIILNFHEQLYQVLKNISMSFNIIYVNDGSTDTTVELLIDLQAKDKRIAILSLSRNFGKEIALQAGLDYAKGDATIVMDADLQDPPELIPEFIHYFEQGFDVVYGKRISRLGESLFKKSTSFLFYRLINSLSKIDIPTDTGDFRLLSARALLALNQLREKHRYMKGLFSWIGFPQKAVPFIRKQRIGGKTKWNLLKLTNLAWEGITSFSLAPLKLATLFGFITAVAAFVYASFVFYKTLRYGDPVQGYPSLMIIMLFLGGVQLIALGILGEYLGRTFDETKKRPLYLVQEFHPGNNLDSRCNKNFTTSSTAFSPPAIEGVTI